MPADPAVVLSGSESSVGRSSTKEHVLSETKRLPELCRLDSQRKAAADHEFE
jgi:hypothetical protein